MKDFPQYQPPTQKSWNGGVMSGSSGGGGGRRVEGGSRNVSGGQSSGGYPHWPPHPIHSHHHHLQSQHSPLPRMMGSYYGGRGLPAHFGGGGWGRPGSGGGSGGSSSGLKPPERWAPVVGSSASGSPQQAEGGMDLSQSRPNGSQPNGVAKEPVSVIATNPLRTLDKPLEPSDRSEDEDEDCMVIEEGEEAPRTGELPPSTRQSAQTRQTEEGPRQNRPRNEDGLKPGEDLAARQASQIKHQRDPSIGQEAPAIDMPPAAHHNPVRQPSLPGSGSAGGRVEGGRPEVSHHLPPSVSQPLRSSDSSASQLQMLQKSSSSHIPYSPSQLQALSASSSSLQTLSQAQPGLQSSTSPHLSASQIGQKCSSPSLLAQQQALHQFAQQILAQKQMQDSQQQHLLAAAQQKLLSAKTAAAEAAAHQLLVEQKLQAAQQLSTRQQETVGKPGLMKAQTKPASPTPAHLKVGLGRSQMEGSSGVFGSRELPAALHPQQAESFPVPHVEARGYQPRHESASIPPHLSINIPSSLQVIPHPVSSCGDRPEADRLEVSETRQEQISEQKPDIACLPPHVQPDQPRSIEYATPSASTPALPSPSTTSSQSTEDKSLPRRTEGSTDKTASTPPLHSEKHESSSVPTSSQQLKFPSTQPQVERVSGNGGLVQTSVETKKDCLPQTVDHVESMLENMFQQDLSSPPHPSETCPRSAVPNSSSPVLTEDKVVAILQDKEEDIKPEIKLEINPEVKTEPSTPQKFMQVESELEKMFAGIVETPGDSDTKPETPESSMSSSLKSSSAKRRGRRPKNNKESLSGSSAKKHRNKSPLSAESLRLKKRFGPRTEKIKEGSNDSSSISTDRQFMKCRGPCIRVTRGKDGLCSSVTVVNSSSASNEEDKDRSLDKSLKRKAPRIIEGRTKGPGLYSSTLSSKYNSTTIDVTWTCIFCNKSSHCQSGLGGEPAGDLFGPYLVHIKVEPLTGGPSDADIVSEQRKRGGGKQLSLRAGGKANHSFSPPQKKSRKLSVSDKEGSSCSSSNMMESNCGVVSKEVWVHEACAVWAPGVILVGPHLIGLDDAVSLSLYSKCAVCGETGACISCLQHGCHKACHYSCARATHWSLDEQTFHARCVNHKKPISMSQALQQSSA